jgi:membrane protein YqaA with SNARE-associated domain
VTTSQDTAQPRPSNQRRLTLLRIAAFVAVIALSVFIYSIRDQVDQLAGYGYLGIFVISFMAYATVLLPAPGIFIVFTMGAVFPPVGVALAAGTGAALGEISGYLFGFSGQGVIEKAAVYQRLTNWMSVNGALTVFLLAAVPNPIFDLAGVVAGALKMRILKFFVWVWLGETVKMLIFALAGARILNIFA